jgi:protein-S-isoprenylcysteine O-methyltransferase Ste14
MFLGASKMLNHSQTIIMFTAGLICFAGFSWGVKGHFRSTGQMPPGMRLISLLSLAGFILFTARLAVQPLSTGADAALLLFAASLALFGWTIKATRQTPPTLAFATDQPDFLLKHGPYRFVRHPFYLSYMLFWIGTACATSALLGWATPLVMLALYQHAASREEQKFAASGLSSAYAAYRRSAGMFLPRLTGLLAG